MFHPPTLHATLDGPRSARAAVHLAIALGSGAATGDRLALDAFLELTDGEVLLVVDAPEPGLLQGLPPRVAVRALPALLLGPGRAHRAAVAEVERLLAVAASSTVLGVDLAQGRTGTRAAVVSAVLARAAAARGVDSRIVGLTWGADVRQEVVVAMRAAGRARVRIHVADTLSHIRASNDGVSRLLPSADPVFAASQTDPQWLKDLHAHGQPLAVVEVAAEATGAPDPSPITRHLRTRGMHVVLLPHQPEFGGDLAACERVAANRDDAGAGVTVVHRLLASAELRSLVGAVRVAVAALPTTAALALSCGTPAVAVAARGAVEALMRSVGQPELRVTPGPGAAVRLQWAVDRVLDDEAAVRRDIQFALPDLAALARRALSGLAESVPVAESA